MLPGIPSEKEETPMKRWIALCLVLALLCGLMPLALAEETVTYTGTVSTGSLHLRKEPSASGKVLNTYKSGTKVQVLENDGTWCKVQIGNKTGYMMTQYLTIAANYPQLGWSTTAQDGTVLNLRAKPGRDAEIVLKTMSGCALELVEEAGEWMRVRCGSVFGYVEKARLLPLWDDFALGFSANIPEAVTVSRLHSAARECGNPTSMTRSDGDFTYTFHFPSLGIPAADGEISAWMQKTLHTFEDDHQQNHSGQQAAYAIEYQSIQVDDRFQSVLLMGEYTVGALKAETMLALNIDTQTGALIDPVAEFFPVNPDRVLFSLESGITALMSIPTDGYAGKPGLDWFRCAVLGKDGVQVFLPAGFYLPPSLGSRKILLTYNQTADSMLLPSALIRSHVRVIDPSKPMIALTFDDGPSDQTDRILSVLLEYNARATFCVIGNKVKANSDIIKRTVATGNEIACHTWSHPKLPEQSTATIRSQITRTIDAVREVSGYEIKVLRPPYGSVNKNVRAVCAELGLVIAHWQVDTKDWSNRNTKKTYNAIMKGAKNGVIVLCHDLYSTTAAAAEQAIPALIEKGYQLVTVSELLSYSKAGPQPGHVYFKVDPEDMIAGQ